MSSSNLNLNSIAIVGSRTIMDQVKVFEILDHLLKGRKINRIISGGAKGVDSLAFRWAKNNGYETHIYFPQWGVYGKKAGFIRNMKIVDACDSLICLWDGESKGAKHSYDHAEMLGRQVMIINMGKQTDKGLDL